MFYEEGELSTFWLVTLHTAPLSVPLWVDEILRLHRFSQSSNIKAYLVCRRATAIFTSNQFVYQI